MIRIFTIARRSLAGAVVTAAGGALIATPAAAEVLPSAALARVSTAGITLSTSTGQARMQSRVRAAARQVCGYDAATRDLGQIAEQNACIAQATARAEVDLAAVTNGTVASNQRVAIGDGVRNPGPAR